MRDLITVLDQHSVLIMEILGLLILAELLYAAIKKFGNRQTKHQEGLLGELLENTEELFLLIEAKSGETILISPHMEQMLGIREDSIRTDKEILYELLSKKDRRELKDKIQNWNRKEPMECELAYHKLHDEVNSFARLRLKRSADGKYDLITIENIEKEKRIREDLEQQIEEVKSIDESKSAFLSKMSHEIRTPMNGMLGMITLAKISTAAGNTADAGDYLTKAEGLSKFLLSIINDILDMSRIESGKLELEAVPFDIFETAEKLKTMFQTTIEDKGIHFVLDIQELSVRYVIGDELRLTQVITNLLSNSSKFTPVDGTISLTFRQVEVVDDKVSLMIRVADTGKGMTPEFLHRIFIPFEQEDSGIARKYGGSGLGMAISDNLIHLMGGQILVDSELGKGTEFRVFVELPIAKEMNKSGTEKKEKLIDLTGRRVLMAEDNRINSMIAVKLLNRQGLQVEVAENGLLAVESFKNHEKGYYDAILMDIHMPEMDGWTATRTIRGLKNLRPDAETIPIIALSADAFVEDKRKSLEMGMNAHVSKPIDFKELQQTLSELIEE